MKVMIATKETQKQRQSDFSYTKEGELVRFGFECDSGKDGIDGTCGCQRSMVGIKSQKATTTMKVVKQKISITDLKKTIKDSLVKAGWLNLVDTVESKRMVTKNVQELIQIANMFSIGTIVEKRGNILQKRLI